MMRDDDTKKGGHENDYDDPAFADPQTEEQAATPRDPRTPPPPKQEPDKEKKKDPNWRGGQTSQEPGMSHDLDSTPEAGRDDEENTA